MKPLDGVPDHVCAEVGCCAPDVSEINWTLGYVSHPSQPADSRPQSEVDAMRLRKAMRVTGAGRGRRSFSMPKTLADARQRQAGE